jgi:hypothetical protein
MTSLEERQREVLEAARNQLQRLNEKIGDPGDTLGIIIKIDTILKEQWGCHCDLEEGEEPDGCVIDEGYSDSCIYAKKLLKEGKGRDDCPKWKRYQ